MMETEIIITEDGSNTLFIPELKEHYHSVHGALQESMHVYINAGLRNLTIKNPSIFEFGLGTGLNALLTFLQVENFQRIYYTAIEKFPVSSELTAKLNYTSLLKLTDNQAEIFTRIHSEPWDQKIAFTPQFRFSKYLGSIIDFCLPEKYDLIYFDAFSPAVQPELWTKEIFCKIYGSMNPGGILVTYCARGEVRRIMQECGLQVERLPGAAGKREMIRAMKE